MEAVKCEGHNIDLFIYRVVSKRSNTYSAAHRGSIQIKGVHAVCEFFALRITGASENICNF